MGLTHNWAVNANLWKIGLSAFSLFKFESLKEFLSMESFEWSEQSLIDDVLSNAEVNSVLLFHSLFVKLQIRGRVLGHILLLWLLIILVVRSFIHRRLINFLMLVLFYLSADCITFSRIELHFLYSVVVERGDFRKSNRLELI